ncbi:PP2C family serine/threonine-protein phosphatase [Streptomyces globisporus]
MITRPPYVVLGAQQGECHRHAGAADGFGEADGVGHDPGRFEGEKRARASAAHLAEPLPFTAHDHLRGDLTNATLETVPGVLIPEDELVIITSDGVHDTVPAERIQELAVAHAAEPQRLADALVAAAGPNEFGYCDDATAAVLLRPEARTAQQPG